MTSKVRLSKKLRQKRWINKLRKRAAAGTPWATVAVPTRTHGVIMGQTPALTDEHFKGEGVNPNLLMLIALDRAGVLPPPSRVEYGRNPTAFQLQGYMASSMDAKYASSSAWEAVNRGDEADQRRVDVVLEYHLRRVVFNEDRRTRPVDQWIATGIVHFHNVRVGSVCFGIAQHLQVCGPMLEPQMAELLDGYAEDLVCEPLCELMTFDEQIGS